MNAAPITICFKAETVQVFQSLTGMSFMGGNQNGGKDACPDDVRTLKTKGADFFKMEWCTVWIDEAHEFRTLSRGFIGAVQLRRKTRMMNACTATPLYTKPEVSDMSV